jgi:hypothetical protein
VGRPSARKRPRRNAEKTAFAHRRKLSPAQGECNAVFTL